MTENELFTFLVSNLPGLMIQHGAPKDLDVVRDFQTSQQGRPENPCIYISRQDLKQYGSPRDSYQSSIAGNVVRRISSQVIQIKIQFQASLTYDPNIGYRVGDLLNLASRVMGLASWRNKLLSIGVQMLRIETNGLTYVVNDRDQYEAVPVLMATLSYTDSIEETAPIVSGVDCDIKRV